MRPTRDDSVGCEQTASLPRPVELVPKRQWDDPCSDEVADKRDQVATGDEAKQQGMVTETVATPIRPGDVRAGRFSILDGHTGDSLVGAKLFSEPPHVGR